MKFRQLAVAVLAAAAWGAASAEDFNLLPSDFSLVQAPDLSLTGQFQLTHRTAGSFIDTITIGTYGVPYSVSITLTTVGTQPVTDIDFVSANLNGVPLNFTKTAIGGVFEAREFGSMGQPLPEFSANTPLILTIIGTAGQAFSGGPGSLTASYTGTVTAVTQVPEPEARALFAAGLAAVVWLARRRRS